MENSNSTKFSLNKTDAQKIFKGALIAVSGAIITYIAQTIGNVDFGQFTPIVVAFGGIVVNALTRWLADFSSQQ